MKKILLNCLTIIFLLISVFVLPLFYPTGIAIYFRLFLLILILIVSLKLFKITFIDRKVNTITANLATVLFSIFVIFILLESVFMFIPRSHNISITLASKLWFAKYWKPVNSMGFRDIEPNGKNPVILFVGNSFTAGHGLKSVDDRFSNIVEKELNKKGKKYNAVNMGINGGKTRSEYLAMRGFLYMTRIKPDVIIFQYSWNDIEEVAMANGLRYKIHPPVNEFLKAIGSGSYLLNYIFWSFPRNYITEPYTDFLNQAYRNDVILSEHKNNLGLFIDYTRNNSIRLIVIVFPFLYDVGTSDSFHVNNIINYFESNNINVIDVSRLIKDVPVDQRTVNVNDSHASKRVNEIIAREILKLME
jgi:hypothetical protein